MKYFYFLITVFFITCASGQSLQEDLMNFEPGQVIIKLKDDVNTKTTYNAQGKASSTLNLVEFLGITSEIADVSVMFSKKAIERSLLHKQEMKQHVSQKASGNAKDGTSKRQSLSLKNIFHLKLADAQNPALVMQLVEDLKNNPNVEFAEPNYRYRINDFEVNKTYTESELAELSLASVPNTTLDTNTPNDPLYTQQNNITQTNIQNVWDNYTTGNGSQIIAVLDTGVDYTHPDLAANIWINQAELNGIPGIDNDGNGFINDVRGWDFINQDNEPLDDNMHGTHVAGIAGAVGNNGIGLAGAAWNVKIMPIKVFQSSGVGNSSTIAEGVIYASVNGATIINMSFGSYAESSTLRAAVENAYATSVLVAAAGNNGKCIGPGGLCAPFFPAAYSYVLGVEDFASYSNFDQDGPIYSGFANLLNYELKAPGTAIISTIPGGGYANLTGTSMASPLVAGAIALYREQKPTESKELLFGNLINTSGTPFVDFYAALETTPQPLLKVLSVTMKDVTNNQNGNGYWEPGETIELLPLVKNYWGISNDVRVGIAFAPFEDTTKAIILQNEIQIGSVSAYATLQNLQQSLKIQLATTLANNVDIKFIVSVWSGPNQDYLTTKEIIINVKKAVLLFGLYTQDLTLTANNEYLVSGNFAMAENTMLTIEPGVVVSFSDDKSMNIQGTINAIGNPLNLITFKAENNSWKGIKLYGISNFQYCVFNGAFSNDALLANSLSNNLLTVNKCVFENNLVNTYLYSAQNIVSHSNFYKNSMAYVNDRSSINNNFINNTSYHNSMVGGLLVPYFVPEVFMSNNIFANQKNSVSSLSISAYSTTIQTPNYFGTSNIDEANARIIDFFEDPTLGLANFNIATVPSEDANGIVWKVLIDGLDAQDSYSQMDPLGIGMYEFKVYFNKAMNTLITPQISYGVIAPYNQKIISEAGSWSADGKIYTVNHNIRIGVADGINRIRVQNAKDLDHFEIPVEDRRFNFLLQSAGSASAGFMATPGIGKIELAWQELDEEILADVLGYNMYRYQINSVGEETEVIQLNSSLIIPSIFADFNVVEGQTYYYKYKILRTSFDETDYSQTISAQPLTSLLGDSNGDFTVNILDVLHDVDYILGNNPTPFVFLAADVNNDNNINVLDVVGTVDLILNPQSQSSSQNGSDLNYYSNNFVGNATLSWEGNDLFIESDFQIGGLQLAFNPDFQFTLSSELPQLENIIYHQQDNKTLMLFSFNNQSFGSGKIKILTKNNDTIAEEDIIRSAVTSTVSGNSLETSILNTTLGTIDAPVQGDKLTFSKIYPNPTADVLFIEYYLPKNADEVTLTIYNIQGQRIKSIKDLRNVVGTSKAEVNVESLSSGTYIIVLDSLEDKGIQFRQFKKFIKK